VRLVTALDESSPSVPRPPQASGNQTECDCGHSARASRSLERVNQNGFQSFGIKINQASGDFLIACAVEAQLTDAHSAGIARNRRAKAPASDRSRRVEITTSRFWIERRTWVVIAEVRKASGVAGPAANGTCALGIATFEFGQAFP
jgi:hypothetical protein